MSCEDKSLGRRLQDPDIWKPFVIVNLMFVMLIWNGMGPMTWFR